MRHYSGSQHCCGCAASGNPDKIPKQGRKFVHICRSRVSIHIDSESGVFDTCRSWSMALFSSILSREMRWNGREPVMSYLKRRQKCLLLTGEGLTLQSITNNCLLLMSGLTRYWTSIRRFGILVDSETNSDMNLKKQMEKVVLTFLN